MGVRNGITLSEVTRICPECILLPSDYESYLLFSKRMFSIMLKFASDIEEYSINEVFLDITGTSRVHRFNYQGIAAKMQDDIQKELGITVSVGVSLSKSLARLCSRLRKPSGLTAVKGRYIHLLLDQTSVESVWGFGSNTCTLLYNHDIKTALDFVNKPIEFAKQVLGKKGVEIWRELRGEYVYHINSINNNEQHFKVKRFAP